MIFEVVVALFLLAPAIAALFLVAIGRSFNGECRGDCRRRHLN